MFPEIPKDLSSLSRAQLDALLAEVNAWFAQNREDPTVELADLRRARDASVTIAQAQEAITAELGEIDQAMAPPAAGDGGEGEPPAVAASGGRMAQMAQHRPPGREPRVTTRPRSIIAAAPGGSAGRSEFSDVHAVVAEMSKRWHGLGFGAGQDEKAIVASIMAAIPDERQLSKEDGLGNLAKIQAVTSREAIVAAGGLCAPVDPYYDQQVIASLSRPVKDALVPFGADRGGIRLVPPPQFSDISGAVRTVADGATNSNTTVTSATAAFTQFDVGGTITGTGIPAGAIIVSVQSATSVTISAAATATATGVSITITQPGGVGSITVAQDAAGGAASVKSCVRIACPTSVEVDVTAIYHCLELNNIAARSFPEQGEGWLQLLLANHARIAETNLLNGISTASKQVTAAAGYGSLRELKARVAQAAAGYRNRNRMDPTTPLRVMLPAWSARLAQADGARTWSDDPGFLAATMADVEGFLRSCDVNVTWYLDSATGKGQTWAAQATGTALTAWPTNIVFYMFAEGSFLFLDGGQLDLGLVRDSALTMGTTGAVPTPGNRFRIFGETFENVAFVGVESIEVTMPTLANGSFAAGVTPIAAGTLG